MSYIRDFFSGQKKSLKPKRNFIKENIKRLQEVSKNRNVEPTAVKSGPFPKFHHSLADYKDQGAGPGYHFRREGSNLSLNQARLKDSYKFHPAGLRNQSSQTLEENDLESLYHEGVIRFPSNRKMGDENKGQVKLVRTICLQTDTPVHSRSPSPSINGSPGGDSVKDFVKMNAQVQSSPKKLQSQRSQDPIKPPPYYQMGVLPKYLREQKKEQERMQKASDEMDPECPPGHTVLPESERLKHLAQLKQRYLELVSELNSIPVRNDTLRNRKRKMELEKELDKVDAGIKLFSRDKLFIKITN